MQPFETDKTLAQNPHPTNTQPQGTQPQGTQPQVQPQVQPQGQTQAKPAYPTLERGSLPGQPQTQQGGYPTFQQGYQQGGYPTFQQGHGQPQPNNYQSPFPSQAYQQPQYQQQGYPMYQQPNYGAYQQGMQGMQQAAEDTVHKQLLMNQMRRNIKASGQGLVLLYAFVLIVGAAAGGYVYTQQTSFQIMWSGFAKIVGRESQPQDTFSDDSCQVYVTGILNLPYFLAAFAVYHFLSICIAFMNTSCCHIFHVFAATIFAGVGVFISQNSCSGFSILKVLIGAKNVPENAAPFYFVLAGATFLACLLNCSWSSNKEKAERDQKNLALMMSA